MVDKMSSRNEGQTKVPNGVILLIDQNEQD